MIDEYGRTEDLVVLPGHRSDCSFGPGFYRLTYAGNQPRYCQDGAEVERAFALLDGVVRELRVERDGYCLDGASTGDANTPDVVDGEWWLGLSATDGMRELGITSEADYLRVYTSVEAAVYRRDNRASQGGVRASIVIKRPGRKVIDVHV